MAVQRMIVIGILFIGLVRAQQTTDVQTNTGQPINGVEPMVTQVATNSDSNIVKSSIDMQPLPSSQNTPADGSQGAVNPTYTAVNTPGTSYNMATENTNMNPQSDSLLLMLPLLRSMRNKKSGGEGGAEGAEGGQEQQSGTKNKDMLRNLLMMQLAGNQGPNLAIMKRMMQKKKPGASQEQGTQKGEKTISLLDLVNLMRMNKAGMNGNADMMSGMTAVGTADGAASPDKQANLPAMDSAFDQTGLDMNLLFDTMSMMDIGGMGNMMGGQAAMDSSQEVGEGVGGQGQMGNANMLVDMMLSQGMGMDNAMLGMLLKRRMEKRRGNAMSDSAEQIKTGLFGAAMSGGEGAGMFGMSKGGEGGGEAGAEGGKGGSRKEKLRKLLMMSLLQDQMTAQNGSSLMGNGMFAQPGRLNNLAMAMLLRGKMRKSNQGGEGGEGANMGVWSGGEGGAEGGGEGGKSPSRRERLRKILMMNLMPNMMRSMGNLPMSLLMRGFGKSKTEGGVEGGEEGGKSPTRREKLMKVLMMNLMPNMGKLLGGFSMGAEGSSRTEGAVEGGGEGGNSPTRREKLMKILMMNMMPNMGNRPRGFSMGGAGTTRQSINSGMRFMNNNVRNRIFSRLISRMRQGQGEEAGTGGEGGMGASEGIQRGIFGNTQGQEGGEGQGQGQGLFGMMGQQEGAAEGSQSNLLRFWSGQGSMSTFRQMMSGEGAGDKEGAASTTGGTCPRYPYTLMADTLVFPYVGGNCKLTIKLQFPDVPSGESRGITGVRAEEISQMTPVSGGEEGETGNKCPSWRLWRVGKYATFIETVPGRCQIVIYAARSNRRGVNVDQVRVNFVNSLGGRSRGTEDFGQWTREGFKRMVAVQSQTQAAGMTPAQPQGVAPAMMPTAPEPGQPQTTTEGDGQPTIRFETPQAA